MPAAQSRRPETEEVTVRRRWLLTIAVFVLVAGACSSSDPGDTTTIATTTTQTPTTIATTTTETPSTTTTDAPPPSEVAMRSLDAVEAVITVDGDVSDWGEVVGLALTLEPIVADADEAIDNREVTIKMAHDDENIYALFTIDDDYDWDADDVHLSGAVALMFPVDTGGPHMGADDEEGENTTGMVDIWHWETECAIGVESGGVVNPSGDGKDPGNDATCNFDDEWATDAETREDDNGAGAENSLSGVWTHSNPVDDGPGVWYFEMSRPLDTGDVQDAVFTVGESTLLALAYWDADFGPDGWDDSTHVQSSNQGWIQVNLK